MTALALKPAAKRSRIMSLVSAVKPKSKHTIEKYGPGYARLWEQMAIRSERSQDVENAARRVLENKHRYIEIERDTSVPWWVVGAIHKMESNLNFATHLHNGDSLKRRTWRVPRGRPVTGSPPFTFEESARDALRMKGLQNVPAWTLERVGFELERYNGFGYRQFNIPTPYLWSYSNNYIRGKYVEDGKWDSRAVSEQTGAMPLIAALMKLDRSVQFAPSILTMRPKPLAPTNESEVLPQTPSAWKVLVRSKTMAGNAWAGLGAAVLTVKAIFGDLGSLLADAASASDAFAAPLTTLANHAGVAAVWVGGFAVAYGLSTVLYARVKAQFEGKIG